MDKLTFVSKKLFLLSVIIASSFVLSACFPRPGGNAAPEKGEFAKGAVIKGFPSDVPLYENAKAVESYGGSEAFGASFVSKDDLGDVADFYRETLPTLGWRVSERRNTEKSFTFSIQNSTFAGSIIVNTAADNKSTAITVSIFVR
jgi:hypothetical protein